MPVTRLEYLIERCLSGQATATERDEMLDLLAHPEKELAAKQFIRNTYGRKGQPEDMNAETAMHIFHAIVHVDKKPAKIVRVHSRWWAIAASVLAILGLGFFFFLINKKQDPVIAINSSKDIPAPTANRAVITLVDGSQVFLDSVENGRLAQVGNIKLEKLANGQIAYRMEGGQILKEVQYNTLTNPKGSKVIDMQLSDGSRVWLNAGSSITYPVAFVGNERKVELNGEGYFEVARDTSKHFFVTTDGVTTEVLGTHFNINSYKDEQTVDVTLLEGSIKVTPLNRMNSRIIKPGQQARVAEQIDVVPADMDQIMAWKEGMFAFGERMDIHIAMNQLARWYGFDVAYESGLKAFVGGEISRQEDGRKVLELLEKTGSVRFKYNGSKILVMSP